MKLYQMIVGAAAAIVATSLPAQVETQTTAMPTLMGGGGDATIYRDRYYSGPAVNISHARPNLGLGWRVSSLRIRRGVWELCSRPNFEGSCTRYNASNSSLLASRRSVQSARPVHEGGWDLLGEREVRDHTDRDSIISWGHLRHRRLRVCVSGHAVRFYSLAVIFFGDGHQDLPVRALIPSGRCTRDIQLVGGARDVSMVKMTYETFSLGQGTATVQVYAQR